MRQQQAMLLKPYAHKPYVHKPMPRRQSRIQLKSLPKLGTTRAKYEQWHARFLSLTCRSFLNSRRSLRSVQGRNNGGEREEERETSICVLIAICMPSAPSPVCANVERSLWQQNPKTLKAVLGLPSIWVGCCDMKHEPDTDFEHPRRLPMC